MTQDARAKAEALRRQAAAIEAAIADESLTALVEAHNEARQAAARAAADAARDELVAALRRHVGVPPILLAELSGAPSNLVAAATKRNDPAETTAEPVDLAAPPAPSHAFGVVSDAVSHLRETMTP